MNGATPGPWKPTNSWSRYGTDEIDDHEMMNYNSQIMARAPFTENEESDIPGELVEEQSVATAHGRTPEEVKANAELIARACNAHDDLVGGLRQALGVFQLLGSGQKPPLSCSEMCDLIGNLINKQGGSREVRTEG